MRPGPGGGGAAAGGGGGSPPLSPGVPRRVSSRAALLVPLLVLVLVAEEVLTLTRSGRAAFTGGWGGADGLSSLLGAGSLRGGDGEAAGAAADAATGAGAAPRADERVVTAAAASRIVARMAAALPGGPDPVYTRDLTAFFDEGASASDRLDALVHATVRLSAAAWRLGDADVARLRGLRGEPLRTAVHALALVHHWTARPGDGLYIRDAPTLNRRLAAARARFGRDCAQKPLALVGQTSARYEARHLQEWLAYHIGWMGYEHVLVYLNADGSKAWDPVKGFDDDGTVQALAPFVDAGLVTVRPMPGAARQTAAMDDAMRLLHAKLCRMEPGFRGPLTALPDCRRPTGPTPKPQTMPSPGALPDLPPSGRAVWVVAQDVDEYLVLYPPGAPGATAGGRPGTDGPPCVTDFLRRFPRAGGVAANWHLFGVSGQLTEPHGQLVAEAYTGRLVWPDGVHPQVKTLANAQWAEGSCGNPHCFRYTFPREPVGEDGVRQEPPWHLHVANATRHVAFHHYDSKSLTHLVAKWLRGRAMTGARYTEEDVVHRASSHLSLDQDGALVANGAASAAGPFLRAVLFGEGVDGEEGGSGGGGGAAATTATAAAAAAGAK
jgi:hypothetical protein